MQRFMSAVYWGGEGGGLGWKKCFALYSENNANELLPSSTFKTIAYYSHSERIRVIDCADFSSLKMESWRGLIILSPTMWWSHTLRGGDRCRDAASWHPLSRRQIGILSFAPYSSGNISRSRDAKRSPDVFGGKTAGGGGVMKTHTH